MPTFIDFTHFTSAKNSFEGNPGLCNLFKFLAVETWKRLEFTYVKPKLKVYETTLTQNIAFAINAYVDVYPQLLIDVWESDDENANGNDLELVIVFSKFGFDFYAPVQAKKIYRDGFYRAMDHGDQIESLIQYAHRRRGYPLYLLYNYIEPAPFVTNSELYGCSIVDAYHLRNHYYNQRVKRKRDGTHERTWIIPSFSNLHPAFAFPWHELVCNIDHPFTLFYRLLQISEHAEGLPSRRRISQGDLEEHFTQYLGFINKDQLDYKGWYKSTDKEILKMKQDIYNIQEKNYDNKQYIFNPQTRIVITL
jgi:hypothetical protein